MENSLFFFFQLNQWFWKHLLIHIISSFYKILLYYYCCTQIKVLIWSIEPISSIPAFVYSQATLHGWVNSSLLWLPRKLNMKQELRADALLGVQPQDVWVRDKFEQERWGGNAKWGVTVGHPWMLRHLLGYVKNPLGSRTAIGGKKEKGNLLDGSFPYRVSCPSKFTLLEVHPPELPGCISQIV